jgi:L-amino acid N-acyltransferase YncA
MTDAPALRPATADDLPAIRALYDHYVATSTCTFQLEPDAPGEREAWFHNRGPAHPVIVADAAGLFGWAALSPWKPRGGYAGSVEVSVYVRPDRHRQGVGRALLAELIRLGRAAGLHTLLAGVCTEHPGSLALHEVLGFRRVAHLREVGRKFGRWLDVVYLQLLL